MAGKQRNGEAGKRQSACVIFPTPAAVLQASGATPMTPRDQSVVDAYLQQLRTNCPKVCCS